MATLFVTLVCGNNLPSKDLNGYSDPYCILKVGTERKKSSVKRRNLSPRWNETFKFNVFRPDTDTLRLILMDKDTFTRDDKIGYCTIPLASLPCNQEQVYTLQLQGKSKWKFKRVRGSLVVKLKAIGFGRNSFKNNNMMGMNNYGYNMQQSYPNMNNMNNMNMMRPKIDGYQSQQNNYMPQQQKVVYTTTTTFQPKPMMMQQQPMNKFVQYAQQMQQPQMMMQQPQPQMMMQQPQPQMMMQQQRPQMMMQQQRPQMMMQQPQQNMMMQQQQQQQQQPQMMQNKFLNFYNQNY